MKSEFIQTNMVTLHVVLFGDEGDKMVILLHGFPEYWKGWQAQAEYLASRGYFVLVPDQRGYNLSEKPKGVRAYRLQELVNDVVGLAKHFKREKIMLAGHDWGAAVAWGVSLIKPELIEKLVIVNVPHPVAMSRYLKHSWRQRLRSWYMVAFQLPVLPEFSAKLFRYRSFVRAMTKSSRQGTFSREEMEDYRETWGQEGALTSMINWYRAAFRHPFHFPDVVVKCPVLIIWGDQDKFLLKELADKSLEFCQQGTVRHIENATHWVLHEEPELTSRLISEFFNALENDN